MNKNQYIEIGNYRQKAMNAAHFFNYLLLKHSFFGAGTIGNLISKLLIRKAKGPTICPTIYNFNLIVDPVKGRGLEEQIYFRGFYEAGTVYILSKCLKENDVFLDIGSNIGLLSIVASKFVGRSGKVYSFEPQVETFSILQKNIKLNRLENVKIYNVACGSAMDNLTLYKNEAFNRGSSSLIKFQENSHEEKISVETIDNFVQTKNITAVKIIKIDVEGWEVEVLKGAKKLLSGSRAPIISIEYTNLHPIHNGKNLDIYKYLIDINNFCIFRLSKGKEIPSKLIRIWDESDLPSHDNLFCFLPVHLESLPKEIFI